MIVVIIIIAEKKLQRNFSIVLSYNLDEMVLTFIVKNSVQESHDSFYCHPMNFFIHSACNKFNHLDDDFINNDNGYKVMQPTRQELNEILNGFFHLILPSFRSKDLRTI